MKDFYVLVYRLHCVTCSVDESDAEKNLTHSPVASSFFCSVCSILFVFILFYIIVCYLSRWIKLFEKITSIKNPWGVAHAGFWLWCDRPMKSASMINPVSGPYCNRPSNFSSQKSTALIV